MSTLVAFHAHPDDEAISTAGTMALAAAAGHRVVLVVATRGEHGEVVDGVLAPGESLAARRVAEVMRSAEILGAARVEFLGYTDSGMMGEPTNDAGDSFWQAPVDEAAARLAAILDEERAAVLTVYDEHGLYGHPDHIQVHRVGVRAAQLAATPDVFEATVDRDHIRRLVDEFDRELDGERGDEASDAAAGPPVAQLETLGVPEARITTTVDVRAVLERKREAMRAHASQIAETSWFLTLPDDLFRAAFGREWYIRRGAPPGTRETTLLP